MGRPAKREHPRDSKGRTEGLIRGSSVSEMLDGKQDTGDKSDPRDPHEYQIRQCVIGLTDPIEGSNDFGL